MSLARRNRRATLPQACQRELREAHRLFTEIGASGHAERLAGELALLVS